ncbi:class II aldolase/adducin family protein [Alkalihalophilus sp. As8PL]|uniref:Class II aldolase/adducin family protein n=1 Tax=Alkalihalophilus sp. As8PL TaxID=3237103 RepID=A0AB39BRL4_9BACI
MNNFTFSSSPSSAILKWLSAGIISTFTERNFEYSDQPDNQIKLVFHFLDEDNVRPYRRKAQATFVVAVLESKGAPYDIFKEVYPFLIRSLANHLMYINHRDEQVDIHFLTPEQGCYSIKYKKGEEEKDFFMKIFQRLQPLSTSKLVIDNEFDEDLPSDKWNGDHITEALSKSGKRLDKMDLLPAPFPLEHYLNKRDMRHLNKLYGIGGLSYGNLSARSDQNHFWMSASGIDKSNMNDVGKDILYIKGYNSDANQMEVSIPPNVKPKRASVDAIEHWMIYKEHPEVGAIVHIHAWMDDVKATEINYPCGTLELAETVAQLVRDADNPAETIIGLKNHGLTITGPSLENIFQRIEGKVQRQVPMN